MTYTEIKLRNGRKYYYRSTSKREGNQVKKKRKYLGTNLEIDDLTEREKLADNEFKSAKIEKGINLLKNKIIKVLKKNKIKKAGIFGSYSRGEQRKDSDVDIIIEPTKGMGLGFVDIALELEKALKRKVHLLTYAGLHHLIRKRVIEEEKRILYG